MQGQQELMSIEEVIQTLERWKIGVFLKENVSENLDLSKKFNTYWKLLRDQLYLYEKNNVNCIFETKRQYYACRQIVRDYASLAKSISNV